MTQVIGHCPECCLEEMRRVRDEIEEGDGDSRSEDSRERRRRRHKERKKKRKKKESSRRERDRDRDRDRARPDADGGMHKQRQREQIGDSVTDIGSEPPAGGGGARRGHHSQDGSENTGSTAPNSLSADGNGSAGSGQYAQHRGHGGYDPGPPAPFRQAPPGPNRTMVLSMAFTDPRTGHRGTYTGQVNSVNHRPDGKGTVYYANGSIAEGTWRDGALVALDDDAGSVGHGSVGHGSVGSAGHGSVGSAGHGRGTWRDGALVAPDGQPRRRHRTFTARDPTPQLTAPSRRAASFHGGDTLTRRRDERSSSRPLAERRRGETSPTGNLDHDLARLDRLGGAPRRGVHRGASASVQSYNSRGERGDEFDVSGGNFSSSASVQHQQYSGDARGGGTYVLGGGGGGYQGYGGGRAQQSASFHGRSGGSFHGRPSGAYR